MKKLSISNICGNVFSDNIEFCGLGLSNGKVRFQKGNMYGRDQYIEIDIPAFSTEYFYIKAGKK